MPVMGKKKPGRPPATDRPADKDIVFSLRFIDPELYEAIKGWASDEKRSTNQAVNVLLEKALRELGRWPPKRKKTEEE